MFFGRFVRGDNLCVTSCRKGAWRGEGRPEEGWQRGRRKMLRVGVREVGKEGKHEGQGLVKGVGGTRGGEVEEGWWSV